MITVIRSQQELKDYYNRYEKWYSFQQRESSANNKGFKEIIEKYTSDYFENNILMLLVVQETSGSVRHKINDIVVDNHKLNIKIEKLLPQMGTCDMAEWHIVVELAKEEYNTQTIEVEWNSQSETE